MRGIGMVERAVLEQLEDLDLVERVVAVILEAGRPDVEPVPDRDLVTPPELARDAPGLNVLEPVEIGFGVALGQDLGPAGPHRIDGGLDDLGRIHEPLIGQHRLDGDLRAIAVRHHVPVLIDPVEPALLLGQRHDALAGLVAVEPVEGQRLFRGRTALGEVRVLDEEHRRAPGHDVDGAEAGALTHPPVVEIVRGRDLHGAGALRGIGIVVGHDRDAAADQRQDHLFPDQGGHSARPPDSPRCRCRPAWSRGGWWRRSGSRALPTLSGGPPRRRPPDAGRSRHRPAGSAGATCCR